MNVGFGFFCPSRFDWWWWLNVLLRGDQLAMMGVAWHSKISLLRGNPRRIFVCIANTALRPAARPVRRPLQFKTQWGGDDLQLIRGKEMAFWDRSNHNDHHRSTSCSLVRNRATVSHTVINKPTTKHNINCSLQVNQGQWPTTSLSH